MQVDEPVGVAIEDLPPHRDQPAAIKLLLGHYRNDARGIGVTIDRTERTASSIPPAKVRFDGEAEVLRLDGSPGSSGRTDYARADRRVGLQVWSDGRITIYVFDPRTRLSSGAIELERDGDADPL